MAMSTTEVANNLQEWAPLSDLFNKIPVKAQNGLFNQDIILTCVDILTEHIALGTNIGLVYWYDRRKGDLQRLRCENSTAKITAVKIVSTVEYMVACGNAAGEINIFQIPKSHPPNIPDSLKPKPKQVERYTVSDLHSFEITSLEWSKNGMKLFSGDKNGLVVYTEIDFYMHICKSMDILNEAYEIVQLSYHQQILLVSTTYRSIVCHKEDKWKVSQVGQKDRKSLGKLGGVIWRSGLGPNDLLLYCARPGLRIWRSDIQGSVQQTLIFKDLLNKECPEVPLINPISKAARSLKPQKEATFGFLLPFNNLIVTFSSEVVYVLDPVNLLVVATISHLRRIVSVAIHKDEIFILEGERSLVRVSYKPETVFNDNVSPVIPTALNFLPLTNSMKDITTRLQASSIISAIPPLLEKSFHTDYDIHIDTTSVINAEEALELPPLKIFPEKNLKMLDLLDYPSGTECKDEKREIQKKMEIYNQISSEEYDDHILFKHKRKKKDRINTNLNTSTVSLSSNSSDDKDANVTHPQLLNISTVGTIEPDLRSPDTILCDIESKEKLLADILSLDKIKFSMHYDEDSCITEQENAELSSNTTYINIPHKESSLNSSNSESPDSNETSNGRHLSNSYAIKKPLYSVESNVKEAEVKKSFNERLSDKLTQRIDNSFRYSKEPEEMISYGPPSGSSNQNSTNSFEPPACITVPNGWKLQEISLRERRDTSDSSLGDWEIV